MVMAISCGDAAMAMAMIYMVMVMVGVISCVVGVVGL